MRFFEKWTLPREKIMGGAPKGGLSLSSGLSPVAPIGERKPSTYKTRVVSTRGNHDDARQTWSPAGRSNLPLSRPSQTFQCHRISKLKGQVSGLGTVHPLLTFNFFSKWCDIVAWSIRH